MKNDANQLSASDNESTYFGSCSELTSESARESNGTELSSDVDSEVPFHCAGGERQPSTASVVLEPPAPGEPSANQVPQARRDSVVMRAAKISWRETRSLAAEMNVIKLAKRRPVYCSVCILIILTNVGLYTALIVRRYYST